MSDSKKVRDLAESILNLLAEKDASFALGMASLMEVIAIVCIHQDISKEKVVEALAFRLSLISEDPNLH
jgi:hypothetical protein